MGVGWSSSRQRSLKCDWAAARSERATGFQRSMNCCGVTYVHSPSSAVLMRDACGLRMNELDSLKAEDAVTANLRRGVATRPRPQSERQLIRQPRRHLPKGRQRHRLSAVVVVRIHDRAGSSAWSLCQRLWVWRGRAGEGVRLQRAAGVRLPMRQGASDLGTAVGAQEHHLPMAGRAALDGHDVLGCRLVKAHGTPSVADPHFADLTIGNGHTPGVARASAHDQSSGVAAWAVSVGRDRPTVCDVTDERLCHLCQSVLARSP